MKTVRPTVEPGVVCDALRDAVAEHGRPMAPILRRTRVAPSVAWLPTMRGSHSVAYGTAAENLVSVTVMLGNGKRSPSIPESATKNIDNNCISLSMPTRAYRLELGRFPRQVSGYGLHYLLDKHGFDAAKAIAGTEGTIGVITKMTVKLVEVPKVKALAVLAFGTVYEAASAAAKLRLPGVATIEGMGGDLLEALRSKNGQEKAGGNLPGNRKGIPAGGWLYCEVGGDSLAEAEALAQSVSRSVDTVDSVVVSEPQEMRELWRIREASAGVVTRLPDGGEAWPNWEDSAVPPENLADYLRDLYSLMDKYSLRGIPFGHFGEGCVHVCISFDFGTDEGISIFHKFMNEAAELVSSYDGSLSGEHGDGRARSALLDRMYSDEMRGLFAQFKRIMDPEGLFNPGVLVDPDDVTDGLRMAPGQRHFELTPVHKFSHDRGSMVNAVNRCVGVSACRSEENSMCPSFQITGDEVHSTRGRARLLSEMFRGESVIDGYESKEVLEALDLCLSCKACASECPVNVDMATYKSEFLHKHYQGKMRPVAHYMMGWLPLLGHIAHKIPLLPRVIDAAMRTPGLKTVIAKVGGLDTSRPLIRFAPTSLRKWHKHRPKQQSTRTVVLWPDSFNSSLETSPATAAVEVLEALGFNVEIPQEFVCCGLTWHSTGQLDVTQRVLKQTAKVMKPYMDRGLTVVGVEPSCTVMLRGEATELSDDPAISQLATSTISFAEFVAPLIKEKVDAGEIQPANISALTQVHCHEKSLGDPQHSAQLLDALGVSQSDIETGCCGLAGNWGFEVRRNVHGGRAEELSRKSELPGLRETSLSLTVSPAAPTSTKALASPLNTLPKLFVTF